jgi:hypothetical protein
MINYGMDGIFQNGFVNNNNGAAAADGTVTDIKLEEQIPLSLQREKLSFHQVCLLL